MSKIIIRTPNHLGDCLMALPAVEALAGECRDDQITLLGPDWADKIYGQVPEISFIPIAGYRLHGVQAISYQTPVVRQERFDRGLLLTPSFSSALIFFRGRVKERYGYAGEGRRILLNHTLEYAHDIVIHRSQRYIHLAEFFLDRKLSQGRPLMKFPATDMAGAEKIMFEFKIDARIPLVAIAPQAVAESRRWGVDKYAQLADRLVRRYDCQIILLGTKAEAPAGSEVARNNRRIFNLCGLTDIGSAAALLSRVLLFVGNDSGLAHLAAAVDIPIVVLSGADNPAETSPLSDKKTVIIKEHLECISCVKNVCPKRGEAFMRCMKEISVEEVFNAGQKLIEPYFK
ncbi:putative ADP-heptose--LPS heptosyltransferase 2 [Candidatus Zixiibacteriota bacterium]|nr:putative ADP-heptose--LPS heptosyltransferase 2 [candidate division Zixibacteria bacterium]